MIKTFHSLPPILFIVIATLFEVSGDAIVRKSIYEHSGPMRITLMLFGAVCLFMYGFSINLSSLEFGKIAGQYIMTLFIVWQLMNYIFFQTAPTLPIVVGGSLIVAGGMVITFWK
jgi:hypothetical protein